MQVFNFFIHKGNNALKKSNLGPVFKWGRRLDFLRGFVNGLFSGFSKKNFSLITSSSNALEFPSALLFLDFLCHELIF